jgi:hypothetical protein
MARSEEDQSPCDIWSHSRVLIRLLGTTQGDRYVTRFG